MVPITGCVSGGAQKTAAPVIRSFLFKLVGISPLIMRRFTRDEEIHPEHRPPPGHWCETCRPLEFINGFVEFCYHMYWKGGVPRHVTQADVDKGIFQLPTIMVKKAGVLGCRLIEGITVTRAKSLFFLSGHDEEQFSDILGRPVRVEHAYQLVSGKGHVMIRHRARFDNWACVIKAEYDLGLIDQASILNLLVRAGIQVGLGDCRPDQTGDIYGRFTIERFRKKDLPAWRRQIRNQTR